MVCSWVCGIGRDGRIVVWLWKLQHGWSFPHPEASRDSYFCSIPIRFRVLSSVGDPMSSRNSWIVWVCLSFGISMTVCSGFRKSSYSSQWVYRFSSSPVECFFIGCYRFRFVPSWSSHTLSSVQCWWSKVHQKVVGSGVVCRSVFP